MARLNIEDCWWTDPRRSRLAKIVGSQEAADGLAIHAWRVAQEFWGRGKHLIPVEIFQTIEGNANLVEAKLAEVRDGFVYVKGSSQYLDWIAERRRAAVEGGKKSAESRRKKMVDAASQSNSYAKQTPTKRKQAQPSDSGSYSVSDSGSISDSDSGNLRENEFRANDLIAGYWDRFKHHHKTEPSLEGKEHGIAKRLAKRFKTRENAELLLDAYFAMPDANIVKAGHPLNLLELKIQEVTIFAKTGKFTTFQQARQLEQKHTTLSQLERIEKGLV